MSHIDEPWLQTKSGRAFTPLNPKADQIVVHDIAWALAHVARFNGHTDRFYSVAEHCVRMSWAVRPEAALWALLHDAGEAYVSDVAAPIKHLVPALKVIETRTLDVIKSKYIPRGVSDDAAAEVDLCDKWIVHEEAKRMMKQPPPLPWWPQPEYTPYGDPFPMGCELGWSPHRAYSTYIERCGCLIE